MVTITVFDPPMCCSTGVCGPNVDPALATFASDLSWLADQGATVKRYNLSQEPKEFAESDLVRELLTESGDKALPTIVVGDMLRSSGRYPSRDELAAWVRGEPAAGADGQAAEIAGNVPETTGGCCGGQTEVVELTIAGVASTAEETSRCCG